jgi:hypothetical protein
LFLFLFPRLPQAVTLIPNVVFMIGSRLLLGEAIGISQTHHWPKSPLRPVRHATRAQSPIQLHWPDSKSRSCQKTQHGGPLPAARVPGLKMETDRSF